MYKTKPCTPCEMPAPDMSLRVLVLNASLKHQPDVSNTGEVAELVLENMRTTHKNLASEIVRLSAFGMMASESTLYRTDAVESLIAEGNTAAHRARLVTLVRDAQGAPTFGETGLDETLEAIRAEMRRFGEAEVTPYAQEWHLANAYIPLEVIAKMAERNKASAGATKS